MQTITKAGHEGRRCIIKMLRTVESNGQTLKAEEGYMVDVKRVDGDRAMLKLPTLEVEVVVWVPLDHAQVLAVQGLKGKGLDRDGKATQGRLI